VRAERFNLLVVRRVVVLAVVVLGLSSAGAMSRASATDSNQALRTCVDRWNQDNMVGWASMSVRILIRGLTAGERSVLSESDPGQRVCTLSLSDRPGDNTLICQMGETGGYECPLVTSDGMPPLTNPNGRTDRHGILKLTVPLAGTHPTPPLPWQRRYPHVDAFILPWTRAGNLRPGLRFVGTEHGTCSLGSEHVVPKSAGRCVDARSDQYDPCFPRQRTFRAGDVAACGSPGDTRFIRWVITRRA
jgi:hypothetical protein